MTKKNEQKKDLINEAFEKYLFVIGTNMIKINEQMEEAK